MEKRDWTSDPQGAEDGTDGEAGGAEEFEESLDIDDGLRVEPKPGDTPPGNYRRVKKRSSAAMLVGFFLVVIVVAAGLFFSLYDFSLMVTGGGLDISVRQRSSSGGIFDTEEENPLLTDSDGQELQLDRYPTGSGTILEITARPEQQLSLQETYERCIPSIVLVSATTSDGLATGTGIVMAEDGYIITNEHVIDGALKVDVEMHDGAVYSALLLGKDSQTDLAVLKIGAQGLTPAQFGDSSSLRVGDAVAAIGNPLGLNFSMSNGIVSALNRDVELNGSTMSMIQTNTAINEGNSGGALTDMHGQVVGITNMKLVSYSAYSSIEGMAFAIPTNVVKPVVDALIADGYVKGRPALGIMCMTLGEAAAESENLPMGIYISSVEQDSDAYGKLEKGDVITAAEGEEITTVEQLNEVKNSLQVGDEIVLTVYRDGQVFDVTIILVDSALLN